MVVWLIVLGLAVGIAGGMPHIALMRGGAASAKVSYGLVATAVSLLAFTGITALVARAVGRDVAVFAGALALAFITTVTASVLAARAQTDTSSEKG